MTTHVFSITAVIYIFYYHSGKILFDLFVSPYIIHHIHEYQHPWPQVSESQHLYFPSAIHLIQAVLELKE